LFSRFFKKCNEESEEILFKKNSSLSLRDEMNDESAINYEKKRKKITEKFQAVLIREKKVFVYKIFLN
jgi:hypothetical protein